MTVTQEAIPADDLSTQFHVFLLHETSVKQLKADLHFAQYLHFLPCLYILNYSMSEHFHKWVFWV